jgi:hypothetical protein
MFDVCEELNLTYTFGIAMNPRLQRASEELLSQAMLDYARTGQPQRQFTDLWYRAESWPQERYVIIKAEMHAEGTNRRAVVTNRLGAPQYPQMVYDTYVERGEGENRNKELKLGLHAGRLSDHRFLANFFRLYLHTAALNLLVRLRKTVTRNPTPADLGVDRQLESIALTERPRRQFFNRRRELDPLGEGQACTWRTRLFKVAAEVLVSARRVLVRLSASWPHLHHFTDVARHTGALINNTG